MRGGPGADRETGLRGGPAAGGVSGYPEVWSGILPEGVHGEKGGISRLRHGYNRNAISVWVKFLQNNAKTLLFFSVRTASGLFA